MLKEELKKENLHLSKTQNLITATINEKQKHIEYLSNYFENYKQEYVESFNKGSSNSLTNMNTIDAGSLNSKLTEINHEAKDNHEEIIKLKNVLNKPFFAKIVFNSNELNHTEYYIGLKNITKNNKVYAIDWRAPISSLYYESKLGKTSYISPKGEIDIDLKYKRQFLFEDNSIAGYIDSDSHINDEILIKTLSKNSSNFMQNIVSTIQEEQDKIIRQDLNLNIVINGVAGSGKTSVAMHRVAYLLYKYKDRLNHQNIHIISPNKLFSNYISKLLPELGEQNVTIKSFYDILMENAPKVKVIDSKMKLITNILTGNSERWKTAKLKYSQKYLDILLKYISQFNNVTILKNLRINNKLFSLKAIIPYFQKHKNSYNIYETIKNTIFEIVTRNFTYLDTKSQENLIEETTKIYTSKINTIKIANNFLNKISAKEHSSNTNIEDLPTFTLIEMLTKGFVPAAGIRHVLIDEMQDYDAVTLKIIKLVYSNATFTVVGDFNQNILFDTNNLVSISEIFTNSLNVSLNKSYRSTNNITELANKILNSNNPLPRQSLREGENPQFEKCNNTQELMDKIKKLVLSINSKETTAIICKNEKEATFIHKALNTGLLITSEHTQISNDRIVITTTYFCKGLEFDNVIIPNASSLNYKNHLEKQNLYIATTRALHNVYGFFLKTPSKFIANEFIKI